jgi:hypothetical protein
VCPSYIYDAQFLKVNPLYVLGVKGPSSGVTTLAAFGVSCVQL